jgi:hypothetical protein
MQHPLNGRLLRVLPVAAFVCATPLIRGQNAVCSAGFGSFDADSTTGVAVSVGPLKQQSGLAQRACQAKLSWDNHELALAPGAAQVDVDLMDVDLGFGSPVVALQVKESDADAAMRYEIYSLAKPPRKLRTIAGGDFYRAADTNLDGRIEIWTHDVGAVSGFEGIWLGAIDFPPPMALRFEDQRLIDVSAEFPSRFDDQIATVRAQLDANELKEFKNSDGKLAGLSILPVEELEGLLKTRVRVLEIVWGYLYSGRDQEAWRELQDMWPASDFERIRAAILDARARGIRREVDGVSSGALPARRRKRTDIYDALTENHGGDKWKILQIDTQPRAIFLGGIVAPAEVPAASLNWEAVVDLVLDAAGKVWSIKTEGKPNKDLIDASAEWKFVPGRKQGHPVACHLRMDVAPPQ